MVGFPKSGHKYSPKRDAMFSKLKDELQPECPGIRVLYPTRWTVRADSLKSVLDNYTILQHLWVEAESVAKESDIRARLIGVGSQMTSFDFTLVFIWGKWYCITQTT